MEVKNKNVLVVGMGRSGISAAEVLISSGASVAVYDMKKPGEVDPQLIKYFDGRKAKCYFGFEPENMKVFDLIVVSPGVPLDTDLIKRARDEEVEIIGEVELAYRIGKGRYIAITGTNGKTTTTVLTGEIFKEALLPTEIVGNVGLAVTKKAVKATPDTWLVTEISSFQLETIDRFHPKLSALLNLTPDHLDRHLTFENYSNAKALVFKNQTADDCLIVNRDDEICWGLAKRCKAKVVPFSRTRQMDFGTYVEDGEIVIRDENKQKFRICKTSDLGILGSHNLENTLAASTIAFYAGICPKTIGKAIEKFKGVSHRLEFVNEIRGVSFINDSKGTNIDASIKAIEAVKGPIVLIAGGYDKGSSFDEFISSFHGKVKALVLLGKTAKNIAKAAERQGFNEIFIKNNMEECVRESFRIAKEGDTVLLSPACASWDMYSNFEQRGNHFKACVNNLEK
jgi:UDP-N-acetylmuramoylalanine--D-glutamate ligase